MASQWTIFVAWKRKQKWNLIRLVLNIYSISLSFCHNSYYSFPCLIATEGGSITRHYRELEVDVCYILDSYPFVIRWNANVVVLTTQYSIMCLYVCMSNMRFFTSTMSSSSYLLSFFPPLLTTFYSLFIYDYMIMWIIFVVSGSFIAHISRENLYVSLWIIKRIYLVLALPLSSSCVIPDCLLS